ncbi:MAG TPA: hypothetical protein ENK57_24015, partial [Polyangiaceae bacterium]|nr:hypothetical protein [Polyangiaceae bacterium]
MALPPLLLAGDLDVARVFADVVQRSHTIELLAAVDLAAGGVEGLYEALAARPDSAAVVWARGEREAAHIAEQLARHPGPSLLYPPPRHTPAGGAHVQIAHGWLTLAGLGAVERLFAIRTVEHVRLSVRGTPEGPAAGLHAALYHAATLVHRLGRQVQIVSALLEDEEHLDLSLHVDGVQWS